VRAKNLLALWALTAALPVDLALVLAALVLRSVGDMVAPRKTSLDPERKTILVSGGKMTKALQLARSFHQAGHRVVLVESAKYRFCAHRFSRAVDRFYTVPKPTSSDYGAALREIVIREQVDLYVPVCSPASSLPDALAAADLLPQCDVLHGDPAQIRMLDDKFAFSQAAATLGLAVPKSFLITDPEDVVTFDFSRERRSYILKSIAYDSIRRLDLTRLPAATPEQTAAFVRSLPISEANPWVMQEFIPGREYCTHGTFRDGELRVSCCCESSAFQVNYRHVEKPAIEAWITTFAARLRLMGQASFDFIEAADDGRVYAIECNPRTHSAITQFGDDPRVSPAYVGTTPLAAPVRPLAKSRPTYWIYHEIWRVLTNLRSPRKVVERVMTIVRGRDAVFDWRDPLPFLMLYHLHVPLLLIADLREGRGWARIDFNIGKLVQPGGD
jgi:glutathione synthase/RimK-type ligase-like ATP-grasp enzyme